MLINIPKDPSYYGLNEDDSVVVMHKGKVLGTGKIYSPNRNHAEAGEDSEIWKAYNMELSELIAPEINRRLR